MDQHTPFPSATHDTDDLVPRVSGLGDLSEPMADLFLTLVAVFLVVLVPRASSMLEVSTAQASSSEEPPATIWLVPGVDEDALLRMPDGDRAAPDVIRDLGTDPVLLVAAPGVTAGALLETAALLQGAGIEVTVSAGDAPPAAPSR